MVDFILWIYLGCFEDRFYQILDKMSQYFIDYLLGVIMFGMGFTEIILILVVAIIALGPEKLPTVAVDVAKFFKKMKTSVDEVKDTINSELNIDEISNIKDEFRSSVGGINDLAKIDLDINSKTIIENKKAKTKSKKVKQPKEQKVEDA
jgi:sec-independent protein translocase protein TatB